MKSRLKVAVFGLACWGMLTPATTLNAATKSAANQKTTKQVKVADVSLHKGGMVVGKVVDGQGKAVFGVPVVVRHKGRNVAVVKTDNKGRYAVKGLRGGIHQIVAANTTQAVRLWSADAAPPQARKSTLLVAAGKVIRGQDGYYAGDAGYVAGGCPPAAAGAGACGIGGAGCGAGGFGAIDVITLATVGAAGTGLVYAIDTNDTLDDLQNQLDNLPQSP